MLTILSTCQVSFQRCLGAVLLTDLPLAALQAANCPPDGAACKPTATEETAQPTVCD